jgi:hypothetical protein
MIASGRKNGSDLASRPATKNENEGEVEEDEEND